MLIIELQRKPVDGFSAGLQEDDDIFKWSVMIIGPPDTPLYLKSLIAQLILNVDVRENIYFNTNRLILKRNNNSD